GFMERLRSDGRAGLLDPAFKQKVVITPKLLDQEGVLIGW
ncbi:hypothetical protein PMI35_02394, partial [Pseudomonas sp. GM78]